MKFISSLLLLIWGLSYSSKSQIATITQGIERLKVEGFAQGAVLSSNGKYLAFSREHYDGVVLSNLETGNTEEVCSHLGSGWGMTWLDDEHLIVRSTKEGSAARERMMGLELISVESKKESPLIPFSKVNRIEVPQKISSGKALIRNRVQTQVIDLNKSSLRMRSLSESDDAWTYDGNRIVSPHGAKITPGRRAVLSIAWSPDGSKALVELLGHPSLYLFIKKSEKFRLLTEKGERPSWLNNDLYIYMETIDDGHKIVGGEIYVASLSLGKTQNLTESFTRIALNPTASWDGKVVFNTDEGKLYLLRLELP